MNLGQNQAIIIASVLFLIAGTAFVTSGRSFMEKGFLFNNAYIYASKEQRKTMNKKPHYRQSAIVFLLLGTVFLLNGFAVLYDCVGLFYVVAIVVIIMLVYAVVSSILIEKNNKQ